MPKKPTAAIILAAGKSTRMVTDLPKVLHEVCGRPMLAYVIDACRDAGIDRIVGVVAASSDADEPVRLDRTAGEDDGRPDAEVAPSRKQFVDLEPGRLAHDDPDRAHVVVVQHEDHRLVEDAVANRRGADQETSGGVLHHRLRR